MGLFVVDKFYAGKVALGELMGQKGLLVEAVYATPHATRNSRPWGNLGKSEMGNQQICKK